MIMWLMMEQKAFVNNVELNQISKKISKLIG